MNNTFGKIVQNLSYVVQVRLRIMSGQLGVLPQFIIIGTQKGGTTSLYDNLVRHPQIISALRKEIHYFDHHFADVLNPKSYYSLSWYRAHFPSQSELEAQNAITGEATPFYLIDSRIPPVLAQIMPNVKLVVLLRNPIHRAYSHYQMSKRKALANASFENLIEQEMKFLQDKSIAQILKDDIEGIQRKDQTSFLLRSLYAEQLKAWLGHFPREQLLILKSEDYFAKPQESLQKVTKFLGVSDWNYEYRTTDMEKNVYVPLSEATQQRLKEFLVDYNQDLYKLLGQDFAW